LKTDVDKGYHACLPFLLTVLRPQFKFTQDAF